MRRIRVLVADDHALLRAGIGALLSVEDDIEVVGNCAGYDELLRDVDRLDPDVVLTDVRMPPGLSDEGIRAANVLRRTHPALGVVVLSQFLDPGYLRSLIADGSSRRGYLLKERISSGSDLVTAVRSVHDGGAFIDAMVVESLVRAERDSDRSPLRRLTAREQETLAEIARGRSNGAIAREFRITERAVEKHVNSIFAKLDLSDDHDLNRRVMAVLMVLGVG